MQISK